jgi:hypothetical protein
VSAVCVDGQCSQDGCLADSDCGDTGVCSCQNNTFGWAHTSFGNSCIDGNCRTDADCASGVCSPSISFDSGPFYGTEGFYCRTPKDACAVDADCGPGAYCAFDSSTGAWACGHTFVAG